MKMKVKKLCDWSRGSMIDQRRKRQCNRICFDRDIFNTSCVFQVYNRLENVKISKRHRWFSTFETVVTVSYRTVGAEKITAKFPAQYWCSHDVERVSLDQRNWGSGGVRLCFAMLAYSRGVYKCYCTFWKVWDTYCSSLQSLTIFYHEQKL